MPYIKQEDRIKFNEILDKLPLMGVKGELEYVIFYCMLKFMQDKDFNYTNLHNTVYAAIHCGDEFRRRYLDERENVAMNRNGDIITSSIDDIGENII
jgi:hypothetical protein